ncbi:MAG: hypothetical protein ACRDNG_05395 [Gaiellaceae bacterium]
MRIVKTAVEFEDATRAGISWGSATTSALGDMSGGARASREVDR